MNAIIIDDEANSRSTLRNLLSRLCPQVELCGEAKNAQEGTELVEALKPDIVFLDIEMPGKNGFEFLSSLKDIHFEVIFTTAFHEYAVKAFRFSAIDFLLKPIDPDELVSAVKKYEARGLKQSGNEQLDLLKQLWGQFNNKTLQPASQQKIALTNQDGVSIVDINQIVWCEALGSYTKFHFSNKTNLVVSKIIKEYEEILSEYNFIRVHNTYLVNANCIVKYIKGDGGQLIMTDGNEIEVSRRKKDEVLGVLSRILK